MKHTIFYTTLVFLSLVSCKPSNPETIVGLRLGLPAEPQIKDAFERKVLYKTEQTYIDKYYIDFFGDVRVESYLVPKTTENNEGVDILTGVTLCFIDKNIIPHDYIQTDKYDYRWISIPEINEVINAYTQKYGKTDVEKSDHGGTIRKWIKGDLVIKLETYQEDIEWDGLTWWRLFVSYTYNDDIQAEMEKAEKEKEKKKNDKSI